MELHPDFRELLSTFNAREVRYLVVDGHAVTFHARPRFTKDLHVWVDATPANAPRLWQALAEYGAPLAGVARSEFEQQGIIFQMGLPPNRIDILTRVDGVDFAEAWAQRCAGEYGGERAWFLSREHLIRNKRACGRPQDLVDARALEDLDP